MSSITIFATLALAQPMNDSGPVCSAIIPTLMTESIMAFSCHVRRHHGPPHDLRVPPACGAHMGRTPYAATFALKNAGPSGVRRRLNRAQSKPPGRYCPAGLIGADIRDRKSTRLNSSHLVISYAVFCLKKKKKINLLCCFLKKKNNQHRKLK